MAKTPAWQRKEGQSPSGGLNAKGRASAKAEGHNLKPPQPEGGSRKNSFCARMTGMKEKLTSKETANDPDSRINKSLRKWNCHADGGPVWDRPRPKKLGKPEPLSSKEKKSAKAMAKAAGRPYPNLVDNMRAARAYGGSVRPEMGAGGDAVKAAMKLIGIHGIMPHNISRLSELGNGIPNPSIAVTQPRATTPVFNNFGRNFLIAKPELVDPANTPVFKGDAFTPRFPTVHTDIDGQKIRLLDDTMVPFTAENASRRMSQEPLRGGEAFNERAFRRVSNYGHPNSFMSHLIPQFKNMEEMKNARNLIKTERELEDLGAHSIDNYRNSDTYDAANILRYHVDPKLFAEHKENSINPAQSYFLDAANSGDFGKYYPTASPQDLDLANKIIADYSNVPTSYFEAKPQRVVQGNEWAGALLPKHNAEDLTSELKNMGINNIHTYELNDGPNSRENMLHQAFGEHMFKRGGAVEQAMEFVRRHRQEGGELEGDVQFAPEDKKFEDSGSLMVGRYGEDKPQPTAHEFVQQQLRTGEPQLPQYDPEAGIETAKEAAHLGAYMHPVTRPFAQAYDAYNAAREVMQNPKDPYAWGGLGLSTMFPGSSRATQLAGAAAAGAGVLGPDEAEAGPNTKFLTDLAHLYRSHYDPSARIFGAPTTIKGNRTVAKNWLSDVKLSRPIEEMSVMSQGHRPMVAERFMEPEEMAGKAMITGLGDRTPAGYELTHINEEELANPVNFMGGMGFGRDIASQGIDRSIWGSAKTRAQAIANQAKRAADEGMEPVFTYVAQGPQSGDFSHHMQDIILGQIQQDKMDDKLAEFIDRRMRENQTASGSTFAPKPNWVGVKSPEMAERMRQRADERVKLTKLMDSATFRDAPGFADVGAARFAATDPSLMYDPSFSAGKSFMTINPRGEIVTNPIHPHPSYNTQISAGDTGHGYLGRFEYELPPELHFKHYRENEIKPSLRGKPLDKQTMSILKQTPTVVATPEWVDMASEYQDIMRRLYGRRRP